MRHSVRRDVRVTACRNGMKIDPERRTSRGASPRLTNSLMADVRVPVGCDRGSHVTAEALSEDAVNHTIAMAPVNKTARRMQAARRSTSRLP